MTELYPLLLEPEFKERPWGARDLAPIYDKQVDDGQPIGEAWLTADTCKVVNGPLKGRTLQELSREYGTNFLGDNCADNSRFPLLIKFLFPREKLSVQVHPDDEGARKIGQPCGKTECWYVLDARPNAQVGLGLKPGVTKKQLEDAIAQKRAEFLLNWIPVNKGELIYVDAGTVHAIGPGSILVETQQNSDTTYRLYDYGRPRELHIEQGLAAAKEKTLAGKVRPRGDDALTTLVTSPSFVVERIREMNKDSYWSGENTKQWNTAEVLVATEGCGILEAEGMEPVTFTRGDAVVVPASVRRFGVRPQWSVEFLTMALPPAGVAVRPPETSMTGFEAAAKG